MAFDPNYDGQINMNAIDQNISIEDWDNTSKVMMKAAVKEGRVNKVIGAETGFPESVRDFYYQLKDIASGDLLSWAVCLKNDDHLFKLTVNRTKTSWTTSQLLRHPCFKKWKKGSSELSLNAAEIRKCKAILLKGSCGAIIRDIKAFRLTEGSGIRYLIECPIECGIVLGRMPNEDELRKIIPKKDANKTQIVSQHKEYKRKRLQHYMRLDKEVYPAIHFGIDLWEDPSRTNHYLC